MRKKSELIQDVFIRTCRDAGFKMDALRAARLAADTIGISPLEVWIAVGTLDEMNAIAAGDHSVCQFKHSNEDSNGSS